MIERLKRLFGRSDPSEDLIAAYVDSTGEAEPDRIEEVLRASGVDVDDARSVRETSQLLRSLDTVEAPKSYALTPEALAARGYSDREIEEILDPRSRRGGFRLRNAAVYVPLAIAAVALTGVALITIGDLTDYVTDRFDGASESATEMFDSMNVADDVVVQTVVVEKEVVVEAESMAMEAPAAAGAPGDPGVPGEPGPASSQGPAGETVVQTVLVEKEVVVTVVVEKEVQVAGETVVQTVVVDREVTVEKEVMVTVLVEKVIEVEMVVEKEVVKEVEVERVVEVEKEVIVEAMPVPTATPAMMAKAAAAEAPETTEESAGPPKESPCAIIPTPAAKASASPEAAATPKPTPTMLPIPTCTPTPTPTATGTPTATPSPTS